MKISEDREIARDRVIGKTDALKPIRQHLQNALNIIRAVFREIFDESAYDRFLQRTKAPHSIESYRAFMRERESAIARKPRCC